MIANNSVRSAISFVHLAIGIFSFCICFVFFWIDKDASLQRLINSNDIYGVIILFIICCCSLFGFVSWQSDETNNSKQTSYVLALLLFIELFVILFSTNQNKIESIVSLTILTFIPALFIFLLAFSKVGQVQKTKLSNEENNDLLDIDFIVRENKHSYYFWKTNRIFSVTCFILSLLLFFFITSSYPSFIWFFIFLCLFFVGSIILWLLPKLGSWIFAITSILGSISICIGYLFFIGFGLPKNAIEKILPLVFYSIGIFSLSFLCISLAMLLLSKEAKEEWKK